MISRRGVLEGLSVSALGLALGKRLAEAAENVGFDEGLSVFVSDIHVGGTPEVPRYPLSRLSAFVDEVLRLMPRPKRVVCFGDLAYLWGRAEDYALSKPELKRLEAVGIELVFCMGNHDRRSEFAKAWPGHLERSPVPGKFVRTVSLGAADLVILDCLQGTDDRPLDDSGPDWGKLPKDVAEWVKDELPGRTRPYLLASHFPVNELKFGGEAEELMAPWLLGHSPMCIGYVHGHDHRWRPEWAKESFRSFRTLRTLCLPSCGLWGDIGHVLCRSLPDRVVCSLEARDYYFPEDPGDGRRLAMWRQRVEEVRGHSLTFLHERQEAKTI